MDDERHSKATPPAAADLTARTGSKRSWIEHAGRVIDLKLGAMLLGRSSSCEIALDDALVSRRHAQLVVGNESVTIQDFGSVNGVYVNGKRIAGAAVLHDGDQLQLGTQVLVFRSAAESIRRGTVPRFGAETLRGIEVAPTLAGQPITQMLEGDATFSAHTLDLLGGVADKVLALGRGEEAEKVLSMTLTNLLTDVRTRGNNTTRVLEKAVGYAVKLADVTGKCKWVDYAIELYAALHRPLPPETVDQLYAVLRRVEGVNLTTLRAYVADLRGMQQSFGPAERFVLQRLEGFERLASLK